MTTYSDSKRVNERIRDVGDSNDRQQWGTDSNQPPKRTVIRWERFLHVRSIKVLLVENDDSTRHVVTALLRNSNYEVIQAANGLQAWKILEDVNNHVDLVLTEVVMPCVSGIGLLCKIMSHDLRKNIPVIMMSCLDSMALVFNCLSKGAVDFLVKPIRKNELKNLWQHIWRRCHSPSGSESHSSNGSGDSATQTSSTKQVIEVASSPAISADNTCSLRIQTNNEAQLDHSKMGKELVARKRRKLESKSTSQVSSRVKVTGSKQNVLPELDCTAKDKMPAHQSTEYPSSECKAVYTEPQMSSKTAHNDEFKEPVCTELSLKKLPEVADKIVQPSTEISALSRYTSTPLTATNEQNMITGKSTQPANNTSLKKERVRYIRPNSSNANFLQSSSHGTSKSTDPLLMSSELTRNDFSRPHDKELPVRHIHHHHHVHHYNDNNRLFDKLAADESPLHDCRNENHITRCSGSDCTGANAGGTNIFSNACLQVKDQCSGETAVSNFCRKRKEPCLQNQVNSHRL